MLQSNPAEEVCRSRAKTQEQKGVLYCFPANRAPSDVRKASMSQSISSPIAVLDCQPKKEFSAI